MKNIGNFFIAVLLMLVCLTSCDEALKEETFGILTPDNVVNTAEDIRARVYGVYDATKDIHRSYLEINALASEIVTTQLVISNGELDQFSIFDANEDVRNFWSNSYQSIKRANDVIDNIDKVSYKDDQERNILLSEAKFLRAFHYFNLVRLFGDIPLITTVPSSPEKVHSERVSTSIIYDELIIPDIEFSIEYLPNSNDNGRIDKGGARMVLSKVYMTLANWDEALKQIKEVINNPRYSLVNDWASIWSEENNNNSEIIFAFPFTEETGQRNGMAGLFAPASSKGLTSGSPNATLFVEAPYFDNYPEGPRKDALFLTKYETTNGEILNYGDPDFGAGFPYPFIKIYFDPTPESSGTSIDIPVLRYADALLMYGEILNEVNSGPNQQAYDAVNMVRRRAAGEEITSPSEVDLSDLSQSDFREAVFQERRWELPFEGHSLFDAYRRGFAKLKDVMANSEPILGEVTLDENDMLMPIPASEIQKNDGISASDQNPGY